MASNLKVNEEFSFYLFIKVPKNSSQIKQIPNIVAVNSPTEVKILEGSLFDVVDLPTNLNLTTKRKIYRANDIGCIKIEGKISKPGTYNPIFKQIIAAKYLGSLIYSKALWKGFVLKVK